MTPEQLLQHHDQARLWGQPPGVVGGPDTAAAYQKALAVRQLRQQRGEVAKGYKIGFTNRTLWQRYEVFGPMWGTVWDTGLTQTEPTGQGSAQGNIDLTHTCQPRLEPEIVFGMKATPAANASLQQLFEAIDWLAPGFEVVQSHCLDWKFSATDTANAIRSARLCGLTTEVSLIALLLCQQGIDARHQFQRVNRGPGENIGQIHQTHGLHKAQHQPCQRGRAYPRQHTATAKQRSQPGPKAQAHRGHSLCNWPRLRGCRIGQDPRHQHIRRLHRRCPRCREQIVQIFHHSASS